MGVYYMWVCPSLREKFDPGTVPNGPDDHSGGSYGIKFGSIPYSAWGVATLALGRWSHRDIRLIADTGDEYERSDEEYKDVWWYILHDGLKDDTIPDDALRFMAAESGMDRIVAETVSVMQLKIHLKQHLKNFGKLEEED